jgi:hypothetical protein
MKKKPLHRLTLSRESLRQLDQAGLRQAEGGYRPSLPTACNLDSNYPCASADSCVYSCPWPE